MPAARVALATLSRVAPALGAEVGWRLWRHVGTPQPVHERDSLVHKWAYREVVDAGGREIMTYRWGSGERVILLVHGWRSRASRFSALVAALQAADVTVIAFDAPANGDSPGRLVTILDYAAAIEALSLRHGPIDTIVAHSFGVLATFVAVREGVTVNRIVGISGMANVDQLVDKFCALAGLGARAVRGMRRRIERRTFPEVADPWRRFVAELDPSATHVPVLLVHDTDDATVDPGQALLIANAHTGPVHSVITSGLGHLRILSDPAVVEEVRQFVVSGR
ncbi:MAG TPA: alpha/beta hydrolase [Rhodoglobus sp.]|nr:alpha/beta hydrolase [Rhodoglobus sp.]